MIKNTLFASSILLFLIACVISADIDTDFKGKVVLGTWFAKEYNFTNDWYIDENEDTITNTKDPYPTSYTDIVQSGALEFDFKTSSLHFVFQLGAGKNVYDFRYAYNATSGSFFVMKSKTFAKINRFFGEWLISDIFSVLLGFETTPTNFRTSHQALYDENYFLNSGVLCTGSKPMLQIMAKKSIGSAINIEGKIAVISPDTMVQEAVSFNTKDTTINGVKQAKVTLSKVLSLGNTTKATVKMPKFECRIGLAAEHTLLSFAFDIVGGYQKYEIIKRPKAHDLIGGSNVSGALEIESFVVGGNTNFKIGPVSIGFTYSGGKNLASYGVDIGNSFRWRGLAGSNLIDIFFPYAKSPTLDTVALNVGDVIPLNKVEDVKTIDNSYAQEMALIINIEPIEAISFEVGIGIVKARHDDEAYNEDWIDTKAFYGQISWKILDMLTLTPEVGYYFYGSKINQGSFTYWGFNTSLEF